MIKLAILLSLTVLSASVCRQPEALHRWQEIGSWLYEAVAYKDNLPGTAILDLRLNDSERLLKDSNLTAVLWKELPEFWNPDKCYRAGFGLTMVTEGQLTVFSFICGDGFGYDKVMKSCCEKVNKKDCKKGDRTMFLPVYLKCNHEQKNNIPLGYSSNFGEEDRNHMNRFPGFEKKPTQVMTNSFQKYIKKQMHRYCKIGPYTYNNCDNRDVLYKTMSYIITADGYKHYMDNLSMRAKQKVGVESCFACEGQCTPSSCRQGACSGDEYYREQYGGLSTSTCTCTYDHACDTVWFVYEGEETEISCWGAEIVKVEVKSHKMMPLLETVRCDNCEWACEVDALTLVSRGQIFTHYSVCGNPGCVTGEFNEDEDPLRLELPHIMRVTDNDFVVRLWTIDARIYEEVTHCKGLNVCENINCIMCYNYVVNYYCWAWYTWLILLVVACLLIYFGSFVLTAGRLLITGICYLVYPFWLILKASVKKSVKKVKKSKKIYDNFVKVDLDETNEEEEALIYKPTTMTIVDFNKIQQYEEEEMRRKEKNGRKNKGLFGYRRNNIGGAGSILGSLSVISCLLCMIVQTNACARTAVLTSQITDCTVSITGEEVCKLTSTTRIALSPIGQDSCLLVKGLDNKPIANLVLTVDNIKVICGRNDLYWTITTTSECSSHFNCRTVGDCYDERCESVKQNERLQYFTELYNHPSNSYCTRTTGCIAQSCFICTPACIFYATSLKVADKSSPYEVFNCPTWSYEVDVTARWVTTAESKSEKLVMQPGVEHDVFDIKFNLVGISTPPVPILDQCILMQDDGAYIAKCNDRGEYVVGRIGEVQCNNRFDAEKMSRACFVSDGMLRTVTGSTSVTCKDSIINIEETLKGKKLPLKIGETMIFEEDGEIKASFHGNALFEMQIDLVDKTISSRSDHNFCFIRVLNVSGCYNCLAGAVIVLETNTNFGTAVGTVSCPESNIVFPFKAQKDVKIQEYRTLISKPNIDEECESICPAGKKKFRLKGTLNYIENRDTRNRNDIITTTGEGGGTIKFPILSFDWLGNWKTLGIMIIVFLVSIPLIILIVKYVLNQLSSLKKVV